MEAPSQTPPPHHQSLSTTTIDIESIDQDKIKEESHQQQQEHDDHENSSPSSIQEQAHADQKSSTNKRYMPLLVINFLLLFIGSFSSSMLSKYYYNHKGASKWVSTWVQCAGFPLLCIPIFTPYLLNLTTRNPFSDFTTKLLSLSIFVGIMLGINNLLISWGVSYLPVSTSALLLSSQLGFNLILSALIVKQKITFSNLNTVILITLGSVILALNSSSERPKGLTQREYFIGFFCTIGAGLLFALYLPIMEMIYKRVYCYEMVMEMQFVMEISATVLATIGMLFDGGFNEMKNEGENVFDQGPRIYWVTIVATIVTWQFCFMGTAGMVFLTCSLTGAICMTALLSMNVLGGVVIFRDEFGGFKAVSTVLCLWGFCSYVYGLYDKMVHEKKKINKNKNLDDDAMVFMMRRNKSESSSLEMIPIVNCDDRGVRV